MSQPSPLRQPVPPPRQAGRRSYGGVAPEERQALRRQRLIEAGIEVFGTRGFHAATVREICGAARLTERYFYESFKGLPDLFAAVFEHITDMLKAATLLALAQSEPQPLKLAEAGLRCFLEFVRDDPRRARIALIDAVSIGQGSKEAVDRTSREYVDLMRGFVTTLYPDAGKAGINVEMLSVGLIGMNTHIATSWVRDGCKMPLEDVLAANLLCYSGMDMVVRARGVDVVVPEQPAKAAAKAGKVRAPKASETKAG